MVHASTLDAGARQHHVRYNANMGTVLESFFAGSSAEPVSPLLEVGAYEALWEERASSFKTIAELFRGKPSATPTSFVPPEKAREYGLRVRDIFAQAKIGRWGVRIHGAGEYPQKLRDARHPIELLYYQGWWDLAAHPNAVAVVGTRNPSDEGVARTRKLVRNLVADGFLIVSGLAKGVDAAAHNAAIESGGLTAAVIGTPLSDHYPAENRSLQRYIAENYLIVSQVPVLRYRSQNPRTNRFFFPERNVTMSAMTRATIIVEAGETSGTLVQARAALAQGRKLFILDSCFQRTDLTWPARFEKLGAVRVRTYDDIKVHLGVQADQDR